MTCDNNPWTRNDNPDPVPVPAVAGTDQSLTVDVFNDNTTYYFGIKAIDDAGLSSLATVSGTTLADNLDPGPVTDLTVTKAKSSALRLAWIASGDDGSDRWATSYDIRYRTGGAVTEGNWASCTQVTGEPYPLGAGEPSPTLSTGHHTMWIMGCRPNRPTTLASRPSTR